MSPRPKRWPPPWLFLILILPGGVYNGFIQTPLSFLLGKAGVAVDRIANIESLMQVPPVLYFLWAPLVDMKLRRRTWLVLASVGSAACLALAMPLIGTRFLTVVTAVLVAGMTINVM